jgi:hypothetical protein
MRALRQANEIRIGRARLKKELASGRARIDEIIDQPPEFARTAKIYDLLLALPKVGPAKPARPSRPPKGADHGPQAFSPANR